MRQTGRKQKTPPLERLRFLDKQRIWLHANMSLKAAAGCSLYSRYTH